MNFNEQVKVIYEVPPAFSLYHWRVDNKCDCSSSAVYSLKKVGNKVFPVYCAFYGITTLILLCTVVDEVCWSSLSCLLSYRERVVNSFMNHSFQGHSSHFLLVHLLVWMSTRYLEAIRIFFYSFLQYLRENGSPLLPHFSIIIVINSVNRRLNVLGVKKCKCLRSISEKSASV